MRSSGRDSQHPAAHASRDSCFEGLVSIQFDLDDVMVLPAEVGDHGVGERL